MIDLLSLFDFFFFDGSKSSFVVDTLDDDDEVFVEVAMEAVLLGFVVSSCSVVVSVSGASDLDGV